VSSSQCGLENIEWWSILTTNPDPKIFFAVVILRAAPNNLLALLWRERIKVRVMRGAGSPSPANGRGKLMM